MSNELTVNKEGLVSLLGDKSPGDVIKPLKTEIHLFDTYVAGTTYLKDSRVLDEISKGDKLTLMREDNPYDNNAILILFNKKKLGYVPARDNIIFARLMDAGKYLIAKIKKINKKGSYTQISVGIYLVDF